MQLYLTDSGPLGALLERHDAAATGHRLRSSAKNSWGNVQPGGRAAAIGGHWSRPMAGLARVVLSVIPSSVRHNRPKQLWVKSLESHRCDDTPHPPLF